MSNQIIIDNTSNKIYVKCKICGEILVTNDEEYIPETVPKGKLESIGGCEHFETINVYKDPISIEHNKENFEKAVLNIEKKKSFILVVPRSS